MREKSFVREEREFRVGIAEKAATSPGGRPKRANVVVGQGRMSHKRDLRRREPLQAPRRAESEPLTHQ